MKDIIWNLAKEGEEDLENTELSLIDNPDELFTARNISVEAKTNTSRINRFVDTKIATDVEEKGAIRLHGTVFNFSKSYKTSCSNLSSLISWATNKKLGEEEIENLCAIMGSSFVPKLRGLDAVAQRNGMDKQIARDTFTEKVWDTEPKLQVIDTSFDKAPVWAKNLQHLERRKS